MQKLFLCVAAVLAVAGHATAEPLRAWVSYVDAVTFAPHTVVDLFLTGTDGESYTVQRRTEPGPWQDFATIAPALGFARQYWLTDDPGLVVTIYPGHGYIFPVTFIDDAPHAMYRAKKD